MNIGYNPHLGYEADVLRDYENMVHSVANKFRRSIGTGVDYEDLVSVGMLGLIEAFRNYDPDRFDGKVTSFSTYAFPMIKWSVQRFLRDKRNTVRVPRLLQEKITAIRKQGWEQETAEKIAEITGWKLSEVREVQKHLNGWSVASLDQTVAVTDKGDEDVTLLDMMSSTEDFTRVNVQEFMSYLSDTEQVVIQMRLKGFTQSDIGKQIRKTQVHVSRVLSRIGTKYHQFEKGELIMARPQIKPEVMGFDIPGLDKSAKVEWFIDEGVPTNPTIGINGQGLSLNQRAIHELGVKPGQCVQVGYEPASQRLLIKVADNGLKLKKNGRSSGLSIVNKRLTSWLQQKELPLKRYVLHADRNSGIHYVYLDRHA
ncbi:sigma-70 family RNA polymerase sigma factor [Paenibacillus sp. GM2]|uniref:sigma-70 family RNA polymerase sigma factor n=1 Tax=Paenibacillus sp. GM2 TaxID=1622070 RepID=UPI0008383043|nr:sigma-70 family RNA polymerase sigma factor [Paenibacillus sp. GM2]